MELYHILPEFTGPNMFPEERMAHYRDNIRPNMQYCGLTFLAKLTGWCNYIREFDKKIKILKKNSSFIHTGTDTTIKSIIRTIKDPDCYDSYYCNVPTLASIIHSLMVAMSVLTILGLIFNLFCITKMYLKFNRNFVKNSFGIYLSAIIISDCLRLVLLFFLYIVPALSGNQYKEQLNMYQKYTYRFVPYLLPLLDLSFAIVAWLVVAMLIQRSNITRAKLIMEAEGFGFANVSSVQDRRKTYRCLALIIGALFVFIIPKFAEYTFNTDITTGKGIVIPLLRIFKLYRIIYLKFLSPSVECMVPMIIMLAYIAVIKYNEVLLARQRHLRQMKITSQKIDSDNLLTYNSQVLSVYGLSRKTQLVIWISVVIFTNLLMKVSEIFVELERKLEGSPQEEWPRLRQITKYLSISISIITIMTKPVIYIHCCPRLLVKGLSRPSQDDVTNSV